MKNACTRNVVPPKMSTKVVLIARNKIARDSRFNPKITPRTSPMAIEMTVIFRPSIRIGKVLSRRQRKQDRACGDNRQTDVADVHATPVRYLCGWSSRGASGNRRFARRSVGGEFARDRGSDKLHSVVRIRYRAWFRLQPHEIPATAPADATA